MSYFRLICKVVYFSVCIPKFIFQVHNPSFIILVLYSKLYTPMFLFPVGNVRLEEPDSSGDWGNWAGRLQLPGI